MQKEATADANETMPELESAAEASREHFEALEIQMQDMKRQKTVDDFALLTATRIAASLKTAHELALDARDNRGFERCGIGRGCHEYRRVEGGL